VRLEPREEPGPPIIQTARSSARTHQLGSAVTIKEVEAGLTVADLTRREGFSPHTFYRWKAKYGGMDVSEAQEKKRLEDENRRLKQIVAELSLDNQALRSVVGKKW
jgi:putative transposase